MIEEMPRKLRSDASENRDRVLEAARALFGEAGMTVTVRDVARRAGVGPATLYRRFPTRQHLIDAAFTDEVHACRRIVEEGCSDPDPWRGLRSIIERTGELNAQNKGFIDALISGGEHADEFAGHRAESLRDIARLIDRAKAAGAVRADVTRDDLVLVLLAGRGLYDIAPSARVPAARRFAALAIAALAA